MNSSASNALVSLIREIIQDEIKDKDAAEICMVQSINDNGTLNIRLLSDMDTIIENISNNSAYKFETNDLAVLYKIKNNLSNSFVFSKVTNVPPELLVQYNLPGNNINLTPGNNINLTPEQIEAINSGVTKDNFVTTNTEQEISGNKIFTGSIVDKANLIFRDNNNVQRAIIENLTGYITGTWLKTTMTSELSAKTANQGICILNNGWLYYRKLSNFINDLSCLLQSKNDSQQIETTGTYGDGKETPLFLKSNDTDSYIGFKDKNGNTLGYFGVDQNKKPCFYDTSLKQIALLSDIPTIPASMAGWEHVQSFSVNAGQTLSVPFSTQTTYRIYFKQNPQKIQTYTGLDITFRYFDRNGSLKTTTTPFILSGSFVDVSTSTSTGVCGTLTINGSGIACMTKPMSDGNFDTGLRIVAFSAAACSGDIYRFVGG